MHSKIKFSFLIFLSVISLYSLLFAVAPDTLWTRTYQRTNRTCGFSVQQTSDSGFIIAGYAAEDTSGNVYLVRTNQSGDTLWTSISFQ